MVSTKTQQAAHEDTFDTTEIPNFTLGLQSDNDLNDLPIGASGDCQNVMFSDEGEVINRDGWSVLAGIVAANAQEDGHFVFYDTNNTIREVIFCQGNLYDVSFGTLVRTVTGVYQSGRNVAAVELDNIGALLYSDGLTIYGTNPTKTGQRLYIPTSGTPDQLLFGSGQVLSQNPPAFNCVVAYSGQVVVGNCVTVDGAGNLTYEPHLVRWADVNDPYTYLALSSYAVCPNAFGPIMSLALFGVATAAVAPTSGIFVGKRKAVFFLSGPTAYFELTQISCPVGIKDGHTAAYIPAGTGALLAFLGSDLQVWATDGVTAQSMVKKRIRKELRTYLTSQLAINLNQRFYAYRDYNNFQYILDVGGGRQYAYDWDHTCWTRYSGWPSGAVVETQNSLGQDQLNIAHILNGELTLSQLATGTTDNGAPINPYWTSGYLRGVEGQDGSNNGDDLKEKLWYWCNVKFATDSGQLMLTFTANQGQGYASSYTVPIEVQTGGLAVAIYDESYYDECYYADDALVDVPNYEKNFRIPKANQQIFNAKDLQIKVQNIANSGVFRVLSMTLKHELRGMARNL